MKRTGYKKILGLAIGERSLFVAEVVAGTRPEVRKLAELVYPEGLAPSKPAELGAALAAFLREREFTARTAVVGIPAKWLVAQSREVPAADDATLASMLRLQAEAQFSTELKDLVYDFVGGSGASGTVLLLATPRKYVLAAVAMCEAARIDAVAVTPSAVVLGALTGRTVAKNAMVLSVGTGGAEMTSQRDSQPNAIRHLRSPEPQAPFVNELRRAVSTLSSGPSSRELVLWDGAGLDVAALSTQLGIQIRSGDLPALGVDSAGASRNGEGRKFAAAVALALAGMDGDGPAVDFLHSRLAPLKEHRIPRWSIFAAVGLIALVAGTTLAYSNLHQQRSDVTRRQAQLDGMKPEVAAATAFVAKVSFAQGWHAEEPRYLSCLRDLTNAIDDQQTYATSLIIHENVRQSTAQQTPAAAAAKNAEARSLMGQLFGKTADQQRVQFLLDRLRHVPTFTDVKLGGTMDGGRSREVSFSITFTFVPPKPGVAGAKQPIAR